MLKNSMLFLHPIMSLFNSESDPGTYDISNKAYDTKEARITVLENETSDSDPILGGFYISTNQVENTEDNEGVPHPGSLQYYRDAFNREGFDLLSEYDFISENDITNNECPNGN